MAEEEDDENEEAEAEASPPSEKPASEKPVADKPPSKAVEWAIAIGMMAVLIAFLLMMMHLMRSARSAVM